MNVKRRRSILFSLYIIIGVFCCPLTAWGTGEVATCVAGDDEAHVYLLTCGAGEEIYSLFGHTAIRYQDEGKGMDVVFNYGLFDFDAPHFALRFALGKPDYCLGVTDFTRFLSGYARLGRAVWQQELDLSAEEKQRLFSLLAENYRPENRVYRYNIFYDNCATRPRDQVERATGGRLVYADDMTSTDTGVSLRDQLHRYTEGHPWSRFGIDLCMGSPADRPICRRDMMFVPFHVRDFFARASLADTAGHLRPLVCRAEQLVEGVPGEETGWPAPLAVFVCLCIVVLCTTAYEVFVRRRMFWGVDLLLFAAAGTGGCILAFLVLFSQHPAVSPNYLLFVLHPFHLLCLPWVLARVRKGKRSRYLALNAAVLTLFIVFWGLIPQKIDWAILPLALCLLVRSVAHLVCLVPDRVYKRR